MIFKNYLLLILIFLCLFNCGKNNNSYNSNQETLNTFQKMLGGNQNEGTRYSLDFVMGKIIATNDNGYIIATHSRSTDVLGSSNNGQSDILIIKLDSTGETEWVKIYGGASNDFATSINQTNDSGYIISGFTKSKTITGDTNNQDYKACIIKMDTVGNVEWQKTYGDSEISMAFSIQQTKDSGFIVVGASGREAEPDIYILKLKQTGDTEWVRIFNKDGEAIAISVDQTLDNGYIVAGFTETINSYDYYIVKLNYYGDSEWERIFGGSNDDVAYSIKQLSDSSYIVAGVSKSDDISGVDSSGEEDIYFIKLTASGEIEYHKMYGGSEEEGSSEGGIWISIWQTKDGGYILSGYSNSTDIPGLQNKGGKDIYILKLDYNYNIEWQKNYGGSGNEVALSIQQTKDGGYIVGGISNSMDISGLTNQGEYDLYILKLNSKGDL